jgi:putative SOS response-associated peptidase YedK
MFSAPRFVGDTDDCTHVHQGTSAIYEQPFIFRLRLSAARQRLLELVAYTSLDLMRWGLVPYWAKGHQIGFSTINDGRDRGYEAGIPRAVLKGRRCLVPIEAFCNWKKVSPKEKQPYAIALADRSIMALAGLWETWHSSAQETIRSFTIITTTPNELCAEVHNRMPVILPPETWTEWLAEEPADEAALKEMLVPYPAERMTMWPVDKRVGNVKNNDPSLIESISIA